MAKRKGKKVKKQVVKQPDMPMKNMPNMPKGMPMKNKTGT